MVGRGSGFKRAESALDGGADVVLVSLTIAETI